MRQGEGADEIGGVEPVGRGPRVKEGNFRRGDGHEDGKDSHPWSRGGTKVPHGADIVQAALDEIEADKKRVKGEKKPRDIDWQVELIDHIKTDRPIGDKYLETDWKRYLHSYTSPEPINTFADLEKVYRTPNPDFGKQDKDAFMKFIVGDFAEERKRYREDEGRLEEVKIDLRLTEPTQPESFAEVTEGSREESDKPKEPQKPEKSNEFEGRTDAYFLTVDSKVLEELGKRDNGRIKREIEKFIEIWRSGEVYEIAIDVHNGVLEAIGVSAVYGSSRTAGHDSASISVDDFCKVFIGASSIPNGVRFGGEDGERIYSSFSEDKIKNILGRVRVGGVTVDEAKGPFPGGRLRNGLLNKDFMVTKVIS